MSGGHFDYIQFQINDAEAEVRRLIEENECGYSKETLTEFQRGAVFLRAASIYLQRIDWLVSGDDGEETFHKRLKEDLGYE